MYAVRSSDPQVVIVILVICSSLRPIMADDQWNRSIVLIFLRIIEVSKK